MAEAETVGDYTILKDLNFEGKNKVKRVLPEWLSKPSIVSIDLHNLSTKVTDIEDLDPILVQQLQKHNYSHFFPIQAQLIPWLLKKSRAPSYLWPCDICVSSPTGSGKTLAFALPLIQLLKNRLVPKVRALVVLPTQDLAAQVHQVFQEYVKSTSLKVALVSGGSVSLQKEQASLVSHCPINGFESLVDIVVTTPGRLLDHLDCTPGFSLSDLRFLVIDEADRILDDFRLEWLQHLEKHLTKGALAAPSVSLHTLKTMPVRPQRLLFSATLSQDPEKLQQLGLFQPKLFTAALDEAKEKPSETTVFVGKFTTPKELTEQYVKCTVASKPLFLYHFLVTEKWTQVLCFIHSNTMAHSLTNLLKYLSKLDGKNLNIVEFNAEKLVQNRLKIIEDFKEGKIDVLVTSDRLARGISLPNAKYVISFDVPKFAKNYIHRIGRTGRAGQSGTALTLVSGKEINQFQELLKATKKTDLVSSLPFSRKKLHPYEDIFIKALESMKQDKQNSINFTMESKKAEKKFNLEQRKSEKVSNVNPISSEKNLNSKLKKLGKELSVESGKSSRFEKSQSEKLIHRKDVKRKKMEKTKKSGRTEVKTVNGFAKEVINKLDLDKILKKGEEKREFMKTLQRAKWQARKAEKASAKLKKEKLEKKKLKKKLKKELKKAKSKETKQESIKSS